MNKPSNLGLIILVFVAGFASGVGFSAWKLGGVVEEKHAASKEADHSPNIELMARISGLEKMLVTNPDNTEVLMQLGNDYFDLGNHQKAVDYYRKSLTLKPDNPDVLTDMAISLRRLGKPQESVAAFRKALEYDPNHQLAMFNMGIVLRDDLKDEEQALAVWEKFLEAGKDSPHAVMIKPWVNQLKQKLGKAGEPK